METSESDSGRDRSRKRPLVASPGGLDPRYRARLASPEAQSSNHAARSQPPRGHASPPPPPQRSDDDVLAFFRSRSSASAISLVSSNGSVGSGRSSRRTVSDTSDVFQSFREVPVSQEGSCGDRYVPSRSGSSLDGVAFAAPRESDALSPSPALAPGVSAASSTPSGSGGRATGSPDARHTLSASEVAMISARSRYSSLLRNELLPANDDDSVVAGVGGGGGGGGGSGGSGGVGIGGGPSSGGGGSGGGAPGASPSAGSGSPPVSRSSFASGPRLLQYRSPHQRAVDEVLFAMSPVGGGDDRLWNGTTATRPLRKIANRPFKVLDAPLLKDDFYLNLVDWSSQNSLAVGLSDTVYLWSACTSDVVKLCTLDDNDRVTSVCWTPNGEMLAVGSQNGKLDLYEAGGRKVRSLTGHKQRVGTLSWNSRLLASGGRDLSILLSDIRAPQGTVATLTGHKQEVCGLRWSPDELQLASGGNDNKLLLWSPRAAAPVQKFAAHKAAVKAIAWSPHAHGLLASGGGTQDRCIRFWNTVDGTCLQCVDTGSQVCNLIWSRTVNEVLSTHGYSLNQIIVWKYPSMQKLTTLTGHTYRVLYLAMSPDGQTVVTGAGDETLRFWNVFPTSKPRESSRGAALVPSAADVR